MDLFPPPSNTIHIDKLWGPEQFFRKSVLLLLHRQFNEQGFGREGVPFLVLPFSFLQLVGNIYSFLCKKQSLLQLYFFCSL